MLSTESTFGVQSFGTSTVRSAPRWLPKFRTLLSVALMEAMSSGMPIICTKIRGNTDLIEDGVSGLFCENTPQALAEMLLKMYADPEKREKLGQAAAERSLLFDEKTIHARMKEIYFGEEAEGCREP